MDGVYAVRKHIILGMPRDAAYAKKHRPYGILDGVFVMKTFKMIVLLFVAGVLLLSLWLEGTQNSLAGDVVRLHVLANSDSEADQTLKLAVRDRVLAEAAPLLEGVEDRDTAGDILAQALEQLAQAGADTVAQEGYGYPVAVSLEETWFPTREYEDFALPAGNYTALRVVIGEGEGRNWWCVVFPPLCLGAVSEQVEMSAVMAGLTEEEIALITAEEGEYVVKFKLLELWDEIKRKLENCG